MKFNFSEEVSGAFHFEKPVVALESTVIAHGLPHPQNVDTALKLEKIIRDGGAVPATIAILDGDFCVGLDSVQIERLASGNEIRKISRRDLPIAVAKKLNCATTVASTAYIAKRAGIKYFSTGGIGGVHRGYGADVSADLPELARTPIVVVCSGAKMVLDLPATREWLETFGVTVLGWNCDELPAFYSRTSGLPVDERVDSAEEAVKIVAARDALGMPGAVLITVPVPDEFAIPQSEIEEILADAMSAASSEKIAGRDITPFLLSRLAQDSGGKTLKANIALLENNARVAAAIALAADELY